MSPNYIRSAFKRAGFPLRSRGNGSSYDYSSSVVSATLCVYDEGRSTLFVSVRGQRAYFKSVASALRCIRGRMAMECVAGNDWALKTAPRAELRLVGAA